MGSAGLAGTQRWLLAAITGTDGEDESAGAHESGAAAGTFVKGSASFPAERRVEIYARGYRLRLVGCLRETYPALRHALGEEVFEAFALDYLDAHPPRGYTLNALGAHWPEHLEATRPDGEGWPDFLIDLARLERTFAEVYDGDGERVVLRTRYPVAGYVAAVRRGDDPPLPAAKPSVVAVDRRDWVVTLSELDEHTTKVA